MGCHPEKDDLQKMLSFAINAKRNAHELSRFIDIVYGAFLSYVLYLIGLAASKIKHFSDSQTGILDTNLFSIVCLSFIVLFVIEDYKGMRITTSICGYYLSSFRFFLDILIVLFLFISTIFLNIGIDKAVPNEKFLLYFALTYFLCCLWSLVLAKERITIPHVYTSLVFRSHLLIGSIWLLVYYLTNIKSKSLWGLKLEFPSLHFIHIIASIFLLYYIFLAVRIHILKNQGLPVDDIIEMYPIKIVRGILRFLGVITRNTRNYFHDGPSDMTVELFPKPKKSLKHLFVQKSDGTVITLSEFINTFAIHAGVAVTLSEMTATNDREQVHYGNITVISLRAMINRTKETYTLVFNNGDE